MSVEAADAAVITPRLWGVAPIATLSGCPSSGVAAVRMVAEGPRREVTRPALPDVHILSWVLTGERDHRIWNDDRLVHQGLVADRTVNIVVAGRAPRALIDRRVDVLHAYIPHRLLTASIADMGVEIGSDAFEVIDPRSVRDPIMEHLMTALLASMQSDLSAPEKLFADYLGMAIGAHVVGRWSSLAGTRHLARRLSAKGGLAPWQLKRATDHMEERLADDVSLEELSKLLELSTFHLCRAFKQSTGLPPHRWRHQRRIERARELLEGTDLPVTEVAAQVGYDDPSQLAAAFRKALGVSPSQYRRDRRS